MDIRKINRSNSEGAYLTDTQPYQEEISGDRESMDNDTLADMATVELLTTLETPIQGIPTMTINNYCHARQIVKATLLAVFAAKPQEWEMSVDYARLVRQAIIGLKWIGEFRCVSGDEPHSLDCTLAGRVSRVFCCSMTKAHQLCRWAGEDPGFRETAERTASDGDVGE